MIKMIIFRGPYDHAIPLMRKSGVRSGMIFAESGERGIEVDDIWGENLAG